MPWLSPPPWPKTRGERSTKRNTAPGSSSKRRGRPSWTNTRSRPHGRLSDAIRSIDASDTRIRAEADDLNAEYRMDERMNLSGLGLDHPVIILGKAGLWDGTRTIASIVAFDNIGDIIADSPWNGMEYETWGIDEHDDLRYSGVHHDGVNTCTFRELKDAPRADRTIGQDDMRRLLRASRPLGPRIRKVYGMPTPAKKRGNR